MNSQMARVIVVYQEACRSFFIPKNFTPRKTVWINDDGSWMCESEEKNPVAVFSILGKMKTGPAMEVWSKFFRYSKAYRMFRLKTGEDVWERA